MLEGPKQRAQVETKEETISEQSGIFSLRGNIHVETRREEAARQTSEGPFCGEQVVN